MLKLIQNAEPQTPCKTREVRSTLGRPRTLGTSELQGHTEAHGRVWNLWAGGLEKILGFRVPGLGLEGF